MRNSDVTAVIKLAEGMQHDRVVRAGILAMVAGDSYDEAIERIEKVCGLLPKLDGLPKGRDRESRVVRRIGEGVRETLTQGLRDVKQLRELEVNLNDSQENADGSE